MTETIRTFDPRPVCPKCGTDYLQPDIHVGVGPAHTCRLLPTGWNRYPLCECSKPYAVYITDARGTFKGIARTGRRLCHVCHGRVPLFERRAVR